MRAMRRPRLDMSSWSTFAWGAILVTTAFLVITYWWLTQDRSIPGTEPGAALNAAIGHYDLLRDGDLLGPLHYDAIHPPLLQIVGAIGMLIGGVNVIAPVMAVNIVFVPLLAVGCYQTAKLVSGPEAGLLAVVFALGTPLLIEQFHVFIVDTADAALVAVAVWLILASERFTRLSFAALAGVAVGLGIETKQQYPFFLAGLLVVVLLRGQGWRNWRGIGVFAGVAFLVGCPWYLVHFEEVRNLTKDSVAAATPGTLPPRLSLENLVWYPWAALNGLLFAPLFVIAGIGIVKATLETWRRRAAPARTPARPASRGPRRSAAAAPAAIRPPPNDVVPELLGGMLGAWLVLLITPIHVVRYLLPMIVYIAVLGTVWIVRSQRPVRTIATAALLLAVVASTLGATFGVGGRVELMLTSRPAEDRSVFGVRSDDRIVLYATRNFMVEGPKRQGDMLALFRALRRQGTIAVTWLPQTEDPYYFNHYGVDSLAAMARLGVLGSFNPNQMPPRVALLLRQKTFGTEPPCLRLADGSGVWVRYGRTLSPKSPNYCPFRTPAFYGP